MPRRKFQWTEELLQLASEGKAVVTIGEKIVPTQLDAAGRAAFEAAKESGVLHLTPAPGPLKFLYWAWCELHRRPVVTVDPRGERTLIFLDMDPAGWSLHARALVEIENLCRRWAPIRFADAPRSWVALTEVPLKSADWVAARLYRIALDCNPAKPKSKRRARVRG